MTPEQLEIVCAMPAHDRFRWLTSEDNPDVEAREAYRRLVVQLAEGIPLPPPPDPPEPTLLQKAGGLVKAAATFVKSGLAVVDKAEFERRHSICQACPKFDAEHDRCRECGCSMAVKPWGRDMHCPLDKW